MPNIDPAGEEDRLGIRSGYWVPLYHGERCFGVYAFFSHYPDAFSREQQVLANTLAYYISTAMENARLFTETSRIYEKLNLTRDQLFHAQKMEAIGQLAGGVAHDFNNQLTVILGYIDLYLQKMSENDSLYTFLMTIRRAAERAASLTRQLLLFSRKQPQNKVPTNLNSIVEDLQKMLARLIGEDITMVLNLTPDLWTINADAANIEQAIINIVLNARDAMSECGTLTIATENVVVDEDLCRRQFEGAYPGRFVCLTVKDTGIGMEEQVFSRLFEPFFTTKEPGKGTGLGLPVAYGIVKAHEGWINVKSKVGQGSTFEVFLPALAPETAAFGGNRSGVEVPATTLLPNGQGERILLVEDEPEVTALVQKALTENGYVVYSCRTVAQALEIFAQANGRFDLILCDVVLPDGRGSNLAIRLKGMHPHLRVLLVSGYDDYRADREVIQEKQLPFLAKPYTAAALVRQVHEIIKQN